MDIHFPDCGQKPGRVYEELKNLIDKYKNIQHMKINLFQIMKHIIIQNQLLEVIIQKSNLKNILQFNGEKFGQKEEKDNIEY